MTSGYDISRRRCRLLSRPACSAAARDLLDHAVAKVALQFAQPHEIRQPPGRQHAAVPANDGRRGHYRAAEHRQLAR